MRLFLAASGAVALLGIYRSFKAGKTRKKVCRSGEVGEAACTAAGLRGWLSGWVESGAIPGAVVGVWRDGKNVAMEVVNPAEEVNASVSRSTIFRIYSMTKPITALAALMLMEKGKLSLEDPVSKYIPAFENMRVCKPGQPASATPETVPADTPVTIKHLLTHTSGLTYGIFGGSSSDLVLRKLLGDQAIQTMFRSCTLEQVCEKLAQTPLCFQPGSAFLYGLNSDVLGRVLEVVYGTDLSRVLRELVFEPLQMFNTGFHVLPDQAHRLASCFEAGPGACKTVSTAPERCRASAPLFMSGGGGLVSTIDDYYRFAQCLLNEGVSVQGVRVISSSAVRLMVQNHLPNNADLVTCSHAKQFSEVVGKGIGYGLSVSALLDPAAAPGARLSGVGEFGWGGVASTWFFVDPVNKLVCVLMTQLVPSSTWPLRNQLRFLAHSLCRE